MGFRSLDIDKADGRQPHNQKFKKCVPLLTFFSYFLCFCVNYFFLWAYTF